MDNAPDPHKESVYRWEASWGHSWNNNHITLRSCRMLVALACDTYKVPRPKIKRHLAAKGFSWSAPRRGEISFQAGEHRGYGGMNVPTTMHEAAHHIVWHLHGERVQDHGRTFLGIFLDLLTRAKVAPRIALEATARAAGLKWK